WSVEVPPRISRGPALICHIGILSKVNRLWDLPLRIASAALATTSPPYMYRSRPPHWATRRLRSAESLGDDLCDPIPLHTDAVQRIGNLHRRLLVGDDDKLGALAQFVKQPQQP